jgi:hypothetical protein
MDKMGHDQQLFTVQQQAINIVPKGLVAKRIRELKLNRLSNFMSVFKEGNVKHQIRVEDSKSIIPFNGFSYFHFSYQGNLPANLIEDLMQMNDFDEESPRKEYRKKRRKQWTNRLFN